jgi:gamma-tubulin complex component 2
MRTSLANASLQIGASAASKNVYETFSLDYKVRWPLTLILSKKAINKYQLIFRHLLFCKYVEKCLENTWAKHQQTKENDV